ncbi:hypothetical protein [Pseudoflavonifractor phocaeensis]|uniref:hypothetical protein n=1 Tax=Pseudoflavonifractor phocaeensis TaxID=1870988 RepID=UPI00195DD4DB|nr:hypothetical protein [Pseudoflavonifractor phocaeensis]MBM6723222.1 hypothetical protein [Pseudoflavonifractor phocaeensis]
MALVFFLALFGALGFLGSAIACLAMTWQYQKSHPEARLSIVLRWVGCGVMLLLGVECARLAAAVYHALVTIFPH